MLIKQKRQGEKAKPYLAQCYQYARLQKPKRRKIENLSSRGGVKRPTLVGSGQTPRGKKGFSLAFKSDIIKKA